MAKPYQITGQTQGPATNPLTNKVTQGWTISYIVPANQATGSVFFPGNPTPDQVDEALSEQAARTLAISGLPAA